MMYLKFTSESKMKEAFSPYIVEGVMPNYIGTVAVDVVGILWKPSGNIIENEYGNYKELVKKRGWHVNLSEELEEFRAYEIATPETPSQVFAN